MQLCLKIVRKETLHYTRTTQQKRAEPSETCGELISSGHGATASVDIQDVVSELKYCSMYREEENEI